MNNPGKIRGSGILWDHHGKLIYVFSTPIGFGSNFFKRLR